MTVKDQLTGLPARGAEAESDQNVVEAALEHPQQVLAGDSRLARSLLVVVAELLLKHSVVPACFLLLPELDAVLALLLATATVVSGRIGTTLDAALVGQAPLALEEQLLPLAAALLALGGGISGHG